jgi:hypothetical protein
MRSSKWFRRTSWQRFLVARADSPEIVASDMI